MRQRQFKRRPQEKSLLIRKLILVNKTFDLGLIIKRPRWSSAVYNRMRDCNSVIKSDRSTILLTNEGQRRYKQGWDKNFKLVKDAVEKLVNSEDAQHDMLDGIDHYWSGRSVYDTDQYVKKLLWYCGKWRKGQPTYHEDSLALEMQGYLTDTTEINVDRTIESFIMTGSNSGFPDYLKQSDKNKKDILESDYDESGYMRTGWARTQYGPSTRVVIGGGRAMKKAGAYIQYRLHHHRQLFTPHYQSPDEWIESINTLLTMYEFMVSLDLSGFDYRNNAIRVINAMECYKKYMKEPEEEEALEYNIKCYTGSWLVLTDGYIVLLHSGIFSGDPLTQHVGNLIHYAVGKKNFAEGKVLSDDGLWLTDYEEEIRRAFRTYEKHGLAINKKKTVISREFGKFLQTYFIRTRDEIEVIGNIPRRFFNLIFQERPFQINQLYPIDEEDQDYVIKEFGYGCFELLRKIVIFTTLNPKDYSFDVLYHLFFDGDIFWLRKVPSEFLDFLEKITLKETIVPNYFNVRDNIKNLLEAR